MTKDIWEDRKKMEKVVIAAELDKYPVLGCEEQRKYKLVWYSQEKIVKGLLFMSVHSEIYNFSPFRFSIMSP